MILFRKITAAELDRYVDARRDAPPTYGHDGFEKPDGHRGFTHVHRRAVIGHGDPLFAAVRDRLLSWRPFAPRWLRIHAASPPQPGQVVAVLVQWPGLTIVNACRVIAVLDYSSSEVRRYGFRYATLAGHLVCGLEEFSVSHDHSDGSVSYEIRAIFQPRHPLYRIACLLARLIQRHVGITTIRGMARVLDTQKGSRHDTGT